MTSVSFFQAQLNWLTVQKSAARSRPFHENLQPESQYAFRGFLRAQAERKDMRKGNRTEARIKLSTCELLEQMPLSALKIQDVCRAAEIAQGTFYLYFEDRPALLNAVLADFVNFVRQRMIERSRASSTYIESVRHTTMAYYRLFENNRGLMKCLLSYYEDFPKASAILSDLNTTWITLNVRSMQKRMRAEGRADAIPEAELFRRCYALGGMVDQYLAYIFLTADKNVTAISGRAEDVVNTLSHIWVSALTI
jgi:TetR/AcrR family transcriptional regulator, ethionamide resistance regulator